MIRREPLITSLHASGWAVMTLSALLPGLIARWFFDSLTGDAHIRGGTSGLLTVLVLLAAGQTVLWLIAGLMEIWFRFTMSGMLRFNMLSHLLKRPGALPLPFSL